MTAATTALIDQDSGASRFNFTISDVEEPSSDLYITYTSSNPTVIPVANISDGGNAGPLSLHHAGRRACRDVRYRHHGVG
jgi:hypothetical protein